MSVRIMSEIFNSTLNPTQRLIMLALADHADDDGNCYPSIARLCQRTGLGERAIQNNIRQLEGAGFIEIEAGGGRKNCNRYCIKTPHMVHETPHLIPETPHMDTENPAPDAPEPSRTIKETSLSNNAREISEILERCASPVAVASFMAYRRKHKSKALTLTAAKRLANSLSEILRAGHDPTDALGLAEERGWATVTLEWFEKATGGRNVNGIGSSGNPGCNAGTSKIAIAGRFARTPSEDCF